MSTTLTSSSYHSKYFWFRCLLIQVHKFRKILIVIKWFDWFASRIKIYSLSYCCIYKKMKKEKTKTASKANTQPSIEYCSVHMWIIFILCFVYVSVHEEPKSTILCLLLSMNRMSISNFQYWWCEYNVEIGMNAYKYQKL